MWLLYLSNFEQQTVLMTFNFNVQWHMKQYIHLEQNEI